jgi:hypothetical protein
MNTATRTALALTAAAVATVALPAAAFADTSTAQLLPPGQSACTSQWAGYQVRAEGTATKLGAKFRVYRNGVLIYGSPSDTATAFAAEFRTAYGTFPGPGTYTVCALNKQATNTFVTLRIRTDYEI